MSRLICPCTTKGMTYGDSPGHPPGSEGKTCWTCGGKVYYEREAMNDYDYGITREQAIKKAIANAKLGEEYGNDYYSQISLAWSAIAEQLNQKPVNYVFDEEEVPDPLPEGASVTISLDDLWKFYEQNEEGYWVKKEDL